MIAEFAVFAVLDLFRHFPPQQRPLSEFLVLLCDILITYNIYEKSWERFGWFWGESGPFWVKNWHSQIA